MLNRYNVITDSATYNFNDITGDYAGVLINADNLRKNYQPTV
jgi:hypothetical protein